MSAIDWPGRNRNWRCTSAAWAPAASNFYHNLATRYGYGDVADHIQDLYLAGKKTEAIDAVPDDLVRNVSLVGPRGYVKERIAAYAEGGATTLLLQPLSGDRRESLRFVEELRDLLP